MMKISWPVLLGVLVLASCRKEDKLYKESNPLQQTEKVATVPTAGADSFYFKAVIDGEPVSWVVADHQQESKSLYRSGTLFGAGQLRGEKNESAGRYLVAHTMIYKNNVHHVPQIAAGFNIATRSADRKELHAYFLPGTKSFGTPRENATDVIKDGVFIRYIDKNNREWFSYSGQTEQGVASFESQVLTDETRSVEGEYSKKWKATFSCRLYDRDGKSIRLEQGEIYGPVL